ncbi:MAG: hypothetical protein DRI57_08430, partial [Deltaproteobacteria bacterium]
LYMEKRLKILAVEDEWCETLEKLFSGFEYELCMTEDLDGARTLLYYEKNFDVAIININLCSPSPLKGPNDRKIPNDDGMTLLIDIKNNYSYLPRIVLTAKPDFDPSECDLKKLMEKYSLETIFTKSYSFNKDEFVLAVTNAGRKRQGEEVMAEYTDFYLHIGPDGHIRAVSDEGEELGKISVEVSSDIQDYLEKIEKNKTNAKELKQFGIKLYDIVFTAKVHTLFSKSEAVAREKRQKIRIRLTIEPDSLASLPWEFTYREERGYFLSTNPSTVLSHYLNLSLPQERVRRRNSPLDMLIIIANPEDQTLLNPDEWEKMIVNALDKPLNAEKIKIRTIKRATRKEISKALLEQQPDIVQFVGHGIYHGGKGCLALVDDKTGKTWELDDERFSALFLGANDHLGLVCLATCESAKSDSPKSFSGIAPRIVQKGVPAVVAMQ